MLSKAHKWRPLGPWVRWMILMVFIWDYYLSSEIKHLHTSPWVKNLETSRNLCTIKNVIFVNVWILSKNHPKAFRTFSTSILNSVWKPRQLSTMYCGHLENNEKILKKAMVGISWEIWCSNQETERNLKKTRENQESGQVCTFDD